MSVTISLTETQALTALGNFLVSVLPPIAVIRGQVNQVAPPAGDFVTMIPILRERLSTTVTLASDGSFNSPSTPGIRTDRQSIKLTVQLDVHGPISGDNAQIVTTLFRSSFATDYFDGLAIGVQALYTSEPRQMPFLNAEQQIDARWSFDVVLQLDPVITSSQDFARELTAGVIEVEATYLP